MTAFFRTGDIKINPKVETGTSDQLDTLSVSTRQSDQNMLQCVIVFVLGFYL